MKLLNFLIFKRISFRYLIYVTQMAIDLKTAINFHKKKQLFNKFSPVSSAHDSFILSSFYFSLLLLPLMTEY